MAVGLVVYGLYGIRHSKLGRQPRTTSGHPQDLA
jgi:hypothetical protein